LRRRMPPPWANALAPYAHPVALGVCEHVSSAALATLEQRADHVDRSVHGQVEIDRGERRRFGHSPHWTTMCRPEAASSARVMPVCFGSVVM